MKETGGNVDRSRGAGPGTSDPGASGGFDGFIPFLELARAHGEPSLFGRLRSKPEDFRVEEDLGFLPSGTGPHHWLLVCKTGCTTAFVAGRLAERYAVPVREVGYSGLKDRHAIATQWFSVPALPGACEPESTEILPGVRIVRAERGRKKLRRGVHAGNRFTIVVREARGDPRVFGRRAVLVAREGVPNYFGSQRFGRGGGNVAGAAMMLARMLHQSPAVDAGSLAVSSPALSSRFDSANALHPSAPSDGRKRSLDPFDPLARTSRTVAPPLSPGHLDGHAAKIGEARGREGRPRPMNRLRRGLYLSAARSLLFNRILHDRVRSGEWNVWIPGDAILINGRRRALAPGTAPRDGGTPGDWVSAGRAQPTGPLWGRGSSGEVTAQARAREQVAISGCAGWSAGLEAAGLEPARRALRVIPSDLDWESMPDGRLVIRFSLPRGAYATAVMRELVRELPSG